MINQGSDSSRKNNHKNHPCLEECIFKLIGIIKNCSFHYHSLEMKWYATYPMHPITDTTNKAHIIHKRTPATKIFLKIVFSGSVFILVANKPFTTLSGSSKSLFLICDLLYRFLAKCQAPISPMASMPMIVMVRIHDYYWWRARRTIIYNW